MGRKAKILSEIKLKIVEAYLEGKISIVRASEELRINESSIRAWIRKYRTFGSEGLVTIHKNSHYSTDIKIGAVNDFISGKGSLNENMQ